MERAVLGSLLHVHMHPKTRQREKPSCKSEDSTGSLIFLIQGREGAVREKAPPSGRRKNSNAGENSEWSGGRLPETFQLCGGGAGRGGGNPGEKAGWTKACFLVVQY